MMKEALSTIRDRVSPTPPQEALWYPHIGRGKNRRSEVALRDAVQLLLNFQEPRSALAA
jgi:hypothetical protein